MQTKICYTFIAFFFSFLSCLEASTDISKAFEESLNYEYEGNYAAALNSMLLVLRSNGKHYTAALRAGWLSYMNGKYEDATQYYERAVSSAPKSVEPLLGLLYPLSVAQRWDKIENTTRQILSMDAKNYSATSKLAYALFMQGRFQEAIKAYRAVLILYPSDLDMKNGLAWSLLRLGKKSEAEQLFREVLSVQKNNVTALSGLEGIKK